MAKKSPQEDADPQADAVTDTGEEKKKSASERIEELRAELAGELAGIKEMLTLALAAMTVSDATKHIIISSAPDIAERARGIMAKHGAASIGSLTAAQFGTVTDGVLVDGAFAGMPVARLDAMLAGGVTFSSLAAGSQSHNPLVVASLLLPGGAGVIVTSKTRTRMSDVVKMSDVEFSALLSQERA